MSGRRIPLGCVAVLLAVLSGCSIKEGQIGTLLRPVPAASVPEATVRARVVLSGDAGSYVPKYLLGTPQARCRPTVAEPCPDPLLAEIARSLAGSTVPKMMVWLGDNVYETGVPKGEAKRAKAILHRQATVTDPSDVRFVPGNHDWTQTTFGKRSFDGLAREAAAIAPAVPMAFGLMAVQSEQVGPLQVVYVDSERAIEQHQFRAQVMQFLRGVPRDQDVLLLDHHPVVSGQTHGQRKRYDRFSDTELSHRKYTEWRSALGDWIADRPGAVILGSGHDHGVQLVEAWGVPGAPLVQVVSGAAAKAHGPPPLSDDGLSIERPGFIVLDLMDDAVVVHEAYLRYDLRPSKDDVLPHPCEPVPDFTGWRVCHPAARVISTVGRARWAP